MGPRSGNGARPPGGPLPVMRRLHDTVAVCALLCVLATAPAAFGAPASPAAATVPPAEAPQTAVVKSDKSVQFRINVNDLALLRQLGIDPTRRVRTARRIEPLGTPSESE